MTNDASRTLLAGSTFTHRQVRWLKISVAIMTALIVLGLGAVAIGMVRQASRLSVQTAASKPSSNAAPYAIALDLGPGQIESVLSANGLVMVYWKGDRADVIISFDPLSGKEIGRVVMQRH